MNECERIFYKLQCVIAERDWIINTVNWGRDRPPNCPSREIWSRCHGLNLSKEKCHACWLQAAREVLDIREEE